MEFAPISGKARVKVKDAFWAQSGVQGFQGLAEAALAQSKGSDGAWNFTVTGSVGHPRMQPDRRPLTAAIGARSGERAGTERRP